jgi:hypothetical protein
MRKSTPVHATLTHVSPCQLIKRLTLLTTLVSFDREEFIYLGLDLVLGRIWYGAFSKYREKCTET